MEQMSEIVKDADYHQIQHFISESPWSAREVMDSVAMQTDQLFSHFDDVHLPHIACCIVLVSLYHLSTHYQ